MQISTPSSTTIYLDESGDLGFSFPASSAYLTIACVCTTNPRALKKAVRRLKQSLHYPRSMEFKATKDSAKVRQQLLSLVVSLGLIVREVSVYKPGVYDNLRREPNALYNYLAGFLVLSCLRELLQARLVVDRREVKVGALPYQLDGYLQFRLAEDQLSKRLEVMQEDSFVSPGVQLADAVAHAIWRFRERRDRSDYDIIQPAIRSQAVFFAPGRNTK